MSSGTKGLAVHPWFGLATLQRPQSGSVEIQSSQSAQSWEEDRRSRVEKSCQVWIVVPICSLGHSMHKSISKSHRFFSLKSCFHFILNVIHLLWQDTLVFSWQRMCGGCRKRTGGLLLGKESEKSKSLPNPKAADGPWCVSWSISWSRYAFLPSRKSRFSTHKAVSRCVIICSKLWDTPRVSESTHMPLQDDHLQNEVIVFWDQFCTSKEPSIIYHLNNLACIKLNQWFFDVGSKPKDSVQNWYDIWLCACFTIKTSAELCL